MWTGQTLFRCTSFALFAIFAKVSLITHVINVHLARLEGAPGYRKRFNGYRELANMDAGRFFPG